MPCFKILMYHGIHDTEFDIGNFDPLYSVTETAFKQQMDYLNAKGYKVVLLSQISECDDVDKTVILTFDDGDKSNYTTALPILRQYNFHAEFFVTTNRIGKDINTLDKYDIELLSKNGMSIQSHGLTHTFLTRLTKNQIYDELYTSKNYIENITNKNVEYLSLPGGRGNSTVRYVANQLGYVAICTSGFGANCDNSDPFNLKRITIYRNTSIINYGKLLAGNNAFYFSLLFRKNILNIMKKILGDSKYEWLHGQVSRVIGRNKGKT
jgi:peptidoglycan/xylan/chitin deacetylase (PgdA/CDA1 family)